MGGDTHVVSVWQPQVQVIAFSDAAFVVSLPGEIFVEPGLALKKGS